MKDRDRIPDYDKDITRYLGTEETKWRVEWNREYMLKVIRNNVEQLFLFLRNDCIPIADHICKCYLRVTLHIKLYCSPFPPKLIVNLKKKAIILALFDCGHDSESQYLVIFMFFLLGSH